MHWECWLIPNQAINRNRRFGRRVGGRRGHGRGRIPFFSFVDVFVRCTYDLSLYPSIHVASVLILLAVGPSKKEIVTKKVVTVELGAVLLL